MEDSVVRATRHPLDPVCEAFFFKTKKLADQHLGFPQKTPGSGEQVEKMILGGVGDRCNNNPKCKLDGPQHENWYPLWSTQMAKKSGPIQVALVPGKENYVVGIYPRYPGTCVLTVKGVGDDAKLCEKIGVSFTGPHSNPGD